MASIGIGFIEVSRDGDLFLYTSEKIENQTSIFYKLDLNKSEGCCKRLYGHDFLNQGITDTIIGETDILSYRLKEKIKTNSNERMIGIAAINPSKIINSGGKVIAFKGRKAYILKTCFGTEGINLFAYQNDKISNHLYFYLNYDISPTCKK
jgi:hypothetical protein